MEKMLKKASAILLITTIMLSMLAYISASASFKGDTIYYTTSTDEVVQFDSSDFVDMLEDYDLEFVQLMITSPYYNGKSEYCMTNDWGKLVIDYNGRGGYLRECHPNDGLSFSRDIDAMEDYIDSLTYIPNEKMDSETIEIKYSISGIDEDGYLEYVEGVIKIEVISETETYTIRYDANGGSGAPASQTKEEDVDIFLSSKKPVRLDYKFLGWAVKASGNVKYDPGDRYEENRDITFYAVWEYIPKKYIVSYNANGGYGAPANQIKPEDEDIYLSSYIPTRYGYEFEGWGIKPNGSARYEPGEIYEENEDIVFYAIWRVPRETYTISYNANGGYGAPPSHKKTEDENTYLSSEIPTRSGYKFLGWATSAQGRVGYHPGSRYTADSSVTFYAIWEYIPEIYTISYHSNGGSGAPASQTKTEKVDTYLSDTEPTRSEYKFLGWATSKTGNVKYQPGSIYTSDDSVTLYAVWEYIPKTYTVSYNANGGSGAPISQTKTEGVAFYLNSVKPTRSGYKFLGWSTTPSGTVSYQPGSSYTEDKAITFYAVWEYLPGSYTVSYNANGGDGAPSSDSKTEGVVLYLSSVIPVRQSHKFLGWSTTPSGAVSYQPGAGYTSDKSVTLYAVWEYIPVNYIVSYNANGGSGAPQNQTKTENTTIYLSSVIPVRHGYKFLGWSTSAWGEANYQPGSSYTTNSSVTLYAVWEDDSRVSSTWECGTGITATLQSNGEMKISGTGMMTDYWDTDAPWHQNRSEIRRIVIDDGITRIGAGTFTTCENLTSVTIPGTVKDIAKNSFSSCTSLTSVEVPDGVQTIGEDVFRFCTALKEVTLPGSITIIGGWAFSGCDSLADIYYGGSESNWTILSSLARVPSYTKVHYNVVPAGTVIGSALRTNITAVINGRAIPSFNVEGYTYIVAEDLRDYGFSVYYDDATRTLAVNRDYSKTAVTGYYIKPYVPEKEVGIKEHDILATDIVTYMDNNYVQSFNINGQTIIRFDALSLYAGVSFDDSTRIIQVVIPGLK